MEINNKKNHLARIRFTFIMLLFAMCVTMNVFFFSNYNLYELLNRTTIFETWTISESVIDNDDGNNATFFTTSFFIKNNYSNNTITKKVCSIFMAAAIPDGIGLLLYLIIVFLFFFLTLFILLPDGWTLVNRRVRLDN